MAFTVKKKISQGPRKKGKKVGLKVTHKGGIKLFGLESLVVWSL